MRFLSGFSVKRRTGGDVDEERRAAGRLRFSFTVSRSRIAPLNLSSLRLRFLRNDESLSLRDGELRRGELRRGGDPRRGELRRGEILRGGSFLSRNFSRGERSLKRSRDLSLGDLKRF